MFRLRSDKYSAVETRKNLRLKSFESVKPKWFERCEIVKVGDWKRENGFTQ